MTYALFDIGGKNTKVAVSDDLKKIDASTSFKTPNNFEKGIKLIADAIAELTDKKPKAIAGGIRGPINEERTGITNDAIITDWIGKSVVEKIQKYYKVPVILENDTAICGIGEAMYGAGKDLEIIAYHTISSGVGGARTVNGVLDETSVGFEPGHQILDIDRTILGEEITPTLENLVSGVAVKNRFGVEPYEIPQSDILWDELAGYLAQGLRNTILYWSPDAIVLGGSMITGDPKIEVDTIRKYTVEALDGFVDCPLIAETELGDGCGLYGAMGIVKQNQE